MFCFYLLLSRGESEEYYILDGASFCYLGLQSDWKRKHLNHFNVNFIDDMNELANRKDQLESQRQVQAYVYAHVCANTHTYIPNKYSNYLPQRI